MSELDNFESIDQSLKNDKKNKHAFDPEHSSVGSIGDVVVGDGDAECRVFVALSREAYAKIWETPSSDGGEQGMEQASVDARILVLEAHRKLLR
jgi:hypothetical protein